MNDGVASADGFLDESAVRDVTDDALDRTVLERSDDIVKSRSIVVTVQNANVVSVLKQETCRPRTDEAVPAGDENLHAVICLVDVAADAFEVCEHSFACCNRIARGDCVRDRLQIAVRAFESTWDPRGSMDRVGEHFADRRRHPEKYAVTGRLEKRTMECERGVGEYGRIRERRAHLVECGLKAFAIFAARTLRGKRRNFGLEDTAGFVQIVEDRCHRAVLAARAEDEWVHEIPPLRWVDACPEAVSNLD